MLLGVVIHKHCDVCLPGNIQGAGSLDKCIGTNRYIGTYTIYTLKTNQVEKEISTI